MQHLLFVCFNSLLTSTADIMPVPFDSQTQTHCMRNFLRMSPDDQDLYSRSELRKIIRDNANDVCAWRFVTCEDGIVRQFSGFFRDNLHIDLQWAPSTIRDLKIFNTQIGEVLETRQLPRCLLVCVITHAGLRGSPDLGHLPPNIVSINWNNNDFFGTLFIDDLPKSLERLFLARSLIRKVIVRNEAVRACTNLQEIQVHHRLKNVKVKCIDEKTPSEKISTNYNSKFESLSSSSLSFLTDDSSLEEFEDSDLS